MEHVERPASAAIPAETDPAAPAPRPDDEGVRVAEARAYQVRLGRGRRSKIR